MKNPTPESGGKGSGGGGDFLSVLNQPVGVGISHRGTKAAQLGTVTPAEQRAREKARVAAAAIKEAASTWSLEQLCAEIGEEIPSDLRQLLLDTISGRVWSRVYDEELRSAVDRLSDLAEDEA